MTEGVKKRVCSVCGAEEYEEIPAAGEHTFEHGYCIGCGTNDPDWFCSECGMTFDYDGMCPNSECPASPNYIGGMGEW